MVVQQTPVYNTLRLIAMEMYYSWKLLHTAVNYSTPLLLFNLYLNLKAINLHCRHKQGPYRWHQPFIYTQKSHFSPDHQPSRGTICQKPSPDLQKPSKDLLHYQVFPPAADEVWKLINCIRCGLLCLEAKMHFVNSPIFLSKTLSRTFIACSTNCMPLYEPHVNASPFSL